MSEKIVSTGTVRCPLIGEDIEIHVVEIMGFFGTETKNKLLCPYLLGSYCQKMDNKVCGIKSELS